MADAKREIGIVGLGRIGGGLARQALAAGIRVVGHDIGEIGGELYEAGLVEAKRLADFRAQLSRPRAVFFYLPAGPTVDAVLNDLASSLEDGDIVVDGGNSYWGDSIRRYRRLREHGLHFVDMGTSGGVEGAITGACFMTGGEPQAVARVEPLLRELATPGGYVHAGPPGAGHFTKLVHNGIEFGMLQAIGEGVDLLAHYPDSLDIGAILRAWRHGSVIRSWLVELMEEAFQTYGGLRDIPSYIEDTGEVNWLVTDALDMQVPIPVIAQPVIQLLASRDRDRDWARAIAMMRQGFGGHPFGPNDTVARQRRVARVGDFGSGEAGHGESNGADLRD